MDLYNKIYNAVCEGLQKSLIINDNDNDKDNKITYQHSNVSNYTDMLKMLVAEFLKNKDIKLYSQIVDYCRNNEVLYKVKNIYELNKIKASIDHIIFSHKDDKVVQSLRTNYNHLLDWADTTNALTVINDKGDELPLHMVNDTDDIKFIKVKSEELSASGNDIMMDIWVDSYQYTTDCWKSSYGRYTNNKKFNHTVCKSEILAEKDFNGFDNTYHNPNVVDETDNLNDFSNFDAFSTANRTLYNNDERYYAYIPSAGQMKIIMDNIYVIDDICRRYGNKSISFEQSIEKKLFWTSTESTMKTAYAVNYSFGYHIEEKDKRNSLSLYMLYRKIEK